jgi:hypothetical protein
MIHYHHPCTGILEEYPRDRLLTRDHFTLLQASLFAHHHPHHHHQAHVGSRELITCHLLFAALAHAANFAAYLLLTLRWFSF